MSTVYYFHSGISTTLLMYMTIFPYLPQSLILRLPFFEQFLHFRDVI